MNHFIGQVSYPVFVSCVFVFFIIGSIFSFIVGIGLATRNAAMLRFFSFMNKSYSTRRITKPLVKPFTEPHFIEPMLLRHSRALGAGIVLGAIASIAVLRGIDDIVFQPMYSGAFSNEAAEILAGYTRSFLLVGNVLCLVVGAMLLFFRRELATVERYTNKWYSLRVQTRPLYQSCVEVDKWVLTHSMISGVTLSLLSLGLGISMYMRL